MLKKIISGLQNGVDLSGLIVAKRYGLETGGTCPRGFITLSGPHPDWAKEYGVKEHGSSKYPPRTRQNVLDSDGTLRIAYDFTTAGEICTLKAIHDCKKPYMDVDILNPCPIAEVIDWLERYNIEVLNIAGNSERTFDGMTGEACEYLAKLFDKMGFKEVSNG